MNTAISTPHLLAPLAKRRATATRYLIGLGLIALSAVLEQTFSLWNMVTTLPDTATFADGVPPLLALLLPFALGALLSLQATTRFEKWGYPLAGRGDLSALDERQQLEFLEAQAKAQRFYVIAAIGLSAWMQISKVGLHGYSWFLACRSWPCSPPCSAPCRRR
ncbi:hypothetical protein ACFP81_08590 [Deinococcus lacus]|uniref:Uncharacterized protein n=1 Tax=Deinococcus lacus TaxID=392561 RepID=A0ABW1YCU2_9DEIO